VEDTVYGDRQEEARGDYRRIAAAARARLLLMSDPPPYLRFRVLLEVEQATARAREMVRKSHLGTPPPPS
jgi:hypothetical protein